MEWIIKGLEKRIKIIQEELEKIRKALEDLHREITWIKDAELVCKDYRFKCYNCGWEGKDPIVIILPKNQWENPRKPECEEYCPRCGNVVELI